MFYPAARLASFLIVATTYYATPNYLQFYSLTFAIGMAHYTIGFMYSGAQAKQILANPQTVRAAGLLCVLGVLIIVSGTPVTPVYFGLHTALTDTYVMRKNLSVRGISLPSRHYFLAFFANCFLYAFMTRYSMIESYGIAEAPFHLFTLAGCLVFYSLYFINIFRFRKSHRVDLFHQMFAFESICFILIPLSYLIPLQYLRWEPWIFYHVVFWMFIPAAKPGFFQDLVKNGRYLIWHAVMAAAFLLMTPITHNFVWAFDRPQMVRIFDIWGYVHITGSFALSVLNPQWIVEGFGLKMAEAPWPAGSPEPSA